MEQNDFYEAIVSSHQNGLERLLLDAKYFGAGATVPERMLRPSGVSFVLGASRPPNQMRLNGTE